MKSTISLPDKIQNMAMLTEGTCRSQTFTMSQDQCYSVFSSITEVHEFVRRAAARYGLQGSVRNEGEWVVIDLRPEVTS